jgi:hypothetical protein
LRTVTSIALRRIVPALVFLLVLMQSCKKDDGFGLDIINLPGDRFGLNYIDTATVLAWSVFEDSLNTSGVVHNLLGSYHDPVFGRTTAGIYTRAQLSTSNVSFGDNPVGDSLLLTLRFNGHYGNPRATHRVRVYAIDDDAKFHRDSAYFSNHTLPVSDLLFDGQVRFNAVDSVKLGGQSLPPMVVIPLNNILIQKFIDASGGANLANNTAFREFFKGLYIQVDEVSERNSGTIGYFNMNADLSALTLYYRNDKDTLSYPFVINDECAKFHHFDHAGYQHAEQGLLQQDTTGNNARLYLQPMAGVKIRIDLPFLDELKKDGPIGITRAELVLRPDPSDNTASRYDKPLRLTIARITDEGKYAFISDFLEGETFMGGDWDPVRQEYRFRVTRHIQDMLNKKYPNNGLVVMVSGASVSGNRAVILGNTPTEQNLSLQIVFANP